MNHARIASIERSKMLGNGLDKFCEKSSQIYIQGAGERAPRRRYILCGTAVHEMFIQCVSELRRLGIHTSQQEVMRALVDTLLSRVNELREKRGECNFNPNWEEIVYADSILWEEHFSAQRKRGTKVVVDSNDGIPLGLKTIMLEKSKAIRKKSNETQNMEET